jgi:uncharacterized protein YtpQ (UPF0354 family)
MGEPPAAPQFAPLEERDPAMIVPLIKRSVKASEETVQLSGSDELIFEPFNDDLFVAYVFDLPGMFKFVSRNDCEALSLDPGQLRTLAVRNLVKRRRKPEIKQPDSGLMLVLDGDLEASLLLVDILWAQLASQIPGDVVVAIPARDVLAVTGGKVNGGIAVLSDAINRVWENPHTNRKLLLTKLLLRREGTSWVTKP